MTSSTIEGDQDAIEEHVYYDHIYEIKKIE